MSEQLTQLSRESSDAEVRAAAVEATKRQNDEIVVRELIGRLKTAKGIDQWRYAEAVVTIAHPFLLGAEDDPFGISAVADCLPFLVVAHLNDRLGSAMEKEKRQAEDADRRRT